MKLLVGDVRREKGMTIRELARLSGVAVSHIARIEAQKANPSIDVMCKLAIALGVEIGDLVNCCDQA